MTDRKMIPDIIIKSSIGEAARKWPNSISRAFEVGGQPNYLFFMLKNPERVKNSNISSRVKCLKFIRTSGFLTKTTLTIKIGMEIKPITIKEFVNEVSAKYKELKDEPTFKSLLSVYTYWDLRGQH